MLNTKYSREDLAGGEWVIFENGKNWRKPVKSHTFAIDTETFAMLDGEVISQDVMFERLQGVEMEEKRRRLSTRVWCWQCYDEYNGFFMTSSFDVWLYYHCLCGYGIGWCYNAKFDFSQIDWMLLAEQKERWKPHEHTGKRGDSKGQAWTYESIHNDMGARYAYKLWIRYKNADRHNYVHAVEFRDFMNLYAGGLKRTLESLDVTDNAGNKVRKLDMNYQAVNVNALTEAEIDYCCNDVKGLYFAVKKFDISIAEQSNNECHCFGEDTNLMTAGGFAKHELLRSLYPTISTNAKRLKAFQREHPIEAFQDKWLRDNHLYRGGISFVNPLFKGKMTTASEMGKTMKRYDVNSEYPYAMSVMHDCIGRPQTLAYSTWLKWDKPKREQWECILILQSVTGQVKRGYMPLWYDPFKRDFVEIIEERGTHLMFECEFEEMLHYYVIEYECQTVLIIRRGDKVFAPFVNENYALKAEAKREGNKGKQAVVKLKLNSAYGKLAERLVRIKGHYELSEESGAVHFVNDGEEVDEKARMSVILGALCAATARVWILSHIRKICGESEMYKIFVYIDTDSIHAFVYGYEEADAYRLGAFKLEAECEAVKYIAPKTYIDIEHVGAIIDKSAIEMHTKGISIAAIAGEFASRDLTLDYIDKRFNYGEQYNVLCAMNVHGGKVLCPTAKFLARPELAVNNYVITSGYDLSIYSEV